jgi:hypothetical protein
VTDNQVIRGDSDIKISTTGIVILENQNELICHVRDLLAEVSMQIEMYNENDAYSGLAPTPAVVLPAIAVLLKHGSEPPAEAISVALRFLEQRPG